MFFNFNIPDVLIVFLPFSLGAKLFAALKECRLKTKQSKKHNDVELLNLCFFHSTDCLKQTKNHPFFDVLILILNESN